MPSLMRRLKNEHTLQGSVDSLPGAHAHRGVLDLSTKDEATTQRFTDGLGLEFRGKVTVDHHVDERSQRSRDANPIDGFDVTHGQTRPMQSKYSRNRRHTLKARWHRQV